MAMISGYHIVEPGWVVLNGLTITPIAFWALAAAPRYMPAAETAMFYLLETVLAPVWVWLIFRETPALPTLIGGSIIIAALAAHSLARMLGKTDIEPA
jgi:drug/metabolite transporter (DMT)-like permease